MLSIWTKVFYAVRYAFAPLSNAHTYSRSPKASRDRVYFQERPKCKGREIMVIELIWVVAWCRGASSEFS